MCRTVSNTKIVFEYIKLKIYNNPHYVGEAELNHYQLGINGCHGFSQAPLRVPADPTIRHPQWYAVTRGRKVGIYAEW